MSHPVKGVDHVFLLVNDLDKRRDDFARMGFTVSPRGMHSAHKGSANHTIMLQTDYFELLGLIAETPGNADRRKTMAEWGEGLHAVACRIDDAAEAEKGLAGVGIATRDLSDFSRPVPLPDGSEGVASFSTLTFAPEETPLGLQFMCQHRTRDTVWMPELMSHANGAVALGGIVSGVDDPEGIAARFARNFAAGRTEAMEGGVRVETGPDSAPLLVLSRAALAARYAAFDMGGTAQGAHAALMIRVEDAGKARDAVSAGGFEIADTAEGFAVGPAEAGGAVIEFVA
ncbi:MAG: VOC family protein [Pseudomonadota bacterium]